MRAFGKLLQWSFAAFLMAGCALAALMLLPFGGGRRS